MKSKPTIAPVSPVTRRSFLKTGAVLSAGIAALSMARARPDQ